jgi:exonuclease SbcC
VIRSLRLKGFRRYVDETISFEPGVCFVSGKNNAGKTSLFLAIEYALFGARSPAALMRPGTTSMGVELVFVGKDEKTYKLQRVHAKPPKARTRVVGHFTLKEIAAGGEIYLCSSDFQDHEADLAKKLVDVTGISRRAFELAVHVKQGEIAAILDGDSKLDIVLGITAATTANEEMRALALLDERAAESLPTLRASQSHIAEEKSAAAAGEKALAAEVARQRKILDDNRAIASAGKARGEADEKIAKLASQVDELRANVDELDDAAATLADAEAELASFVEEHGDLAALTSRAQDREGERAKLAQLGGVDVVEARGDLRGRIRRAEAELASGAPTCHCCGAPIARDAMSKLVSTWKKELDDVDANVAKLRALDDDLAKLSRERAELGSLAGAVTAARRTLDDATKAAREAAKSAGAPKEVVNASEPGPFAEFLDEREREIDAARMKNAAERAKAEAVVEAAEDALAAAQARVDEHSARAAKLDREEARLAAAVDALTQRSARSEELRALAAAFKALQEELRTKAAHDLAESTLRIHRALSVDDELAAVRIDAARYQVLVTARDHDVEAPATHAQGGGHRLLLGLAFRLALVERLGPFPFVLLDEPTYGLDERNRAALLERIQSLKLSPQIVLITHQPMGDVAGLRIAIERPDHEATP